MENTQTRDSGNDHTKWPGTFKNKNASYARPSQFNTALAAANRKGSTRQLQTPITRRW